MDHAQEGEWIARRRIGVAGRGLSPVKLVLSDEAGGAGAPGVMGLYRRRRGVVDDSHTQGSGRHRRICSCGSVKIHSNAHQQKNFGLKLLKFKSFLGET